MNFTIDQSMKSWLEKYDIEMYSVYNEWKSVTAERFVKTLKFINTLHYKSITYNKCFNIIFLSYNTI